MKKEPPEPYERCVAIVKKTGQRCRARISGSSTRCRHHGGHGWKPKAPPVHPNMTEHNKDIQSRPETIKRMKNNQLGALYHLFSRDYLTKPEQEIYDAVTKLLRETYELDKAADEIILNEIGNHAAKAYMSVRVGNRAAHKDYTRVMRQMLSELDVRRDKRRSHGEGKALDITPQAAIFMLLDKHGQRHHLQAGQHGNALPAHVTTEDEIIEMKNDDQGKDAKSISPVYPGDDDDDDPSPKAHDDDLNQQEGRSSREENLAGNDDDDSNESENGD